ncbi:unnamed protein product [Leuciscus chuanchicus]
MHRVLKTLGRGVAMHQAVVKTMKEERVLSKATLLNDKDCRIISCLQCFRPQEMLPNHLLRVCMKNQTNEERNAEVDRAKKSIKARTRDYNAMVKRYPDEALLEDLRERHFLILNDPMDAQAESSHRPPGAAVETRNKNSSSDEPADERRGLKQKRGRGAADLDDRDFGAFLLQFPATASSSPHTKKQRTTAGFPAVQFVKREEHLLSQCSRRPPTVSKVSLLIQKEGWTGNCPRPEDIVAKWRPVSRVQVESDPWIITTIHNQKTVSTSSSEEIVGGGNIPPLPPSPPPNIPILPRQGANYDDFERTKRRMTTDFHLSSEEIIGGGIGRNGLRLKGIRRNGIRHKGIGRNGLRLKGIRQNGIRLKGIRRNGIRLKGIRRNGIRHKGIGQNGLRLKGIRHKGIGRNGLRLKGIRRNGIRHKGIGRNGIRLKGFRRNGIRHKGIGRNGLRLKGIRRNGIRLKGIRRNGIRHKGIRRNGIRHKGIRRNGLRLKGIRRNGIRLKGIRRNGIRHKGIGRNGLRLKGIRRNGIGRNGLRLKGIG